MGNLRHSCGPDAPDSCYMHTLWDWSPLNGLLGTSRVGDVDGIIERCGHFLLLDGKRVGANGSRDIKNGQRYMYVAFARAGHTVVVFHGSPPATVQWVRVWLPGGVFIPESECDLEALCIYVAEWYHWAGSKAAA